MIDAFSEVLGLNVENLCIDMFYWFDKSSKWKGKLNEYFRFSDQEYQSVLEHVSVRWLSLEKCMNRILKKFGSLKSYFLSEEWVDERFQRLHRWFSNHLLEPALMFQTNAASLFTNFNLLLQRDESNLVIISCSTCCLIGPVKATWVCASFDSNLVRRGNKYCSWWWLDKRWATHTCFDSCNEKLWTKTC